MKFWQKIPGSEFADRGLTRSSAFRLALAVLAVLAVSLVVELYSVNVIELTIQFFAYGSLTLVAFMMALIGQVRLLLIVTGHATVLKFGVTPYSAPFAKSQAEVVLRRPRIDSYLALLTISIIGALAAEVLMEPMPNGPDFISIAICSLIAALFITKSNSAPSLNWLLAPHCVEAVMPYKSYYAAAQRLRFELNSRLGALAVEPLESSNASGGSLNSFYYYQPATRHMVVLLAKLVCALAGIIAAWLFSPGVVHSTFTLVSTFLTPQGEPPLSPMQAVVWFVNSGALFYAGICWILAVVVTNIRLVNTGLTLNKRLSPQNNPLELLEAAKGYAEATRYGSRQSTEKVWLIVLMYVPLLLAMDIAGYCPTIGCSAGFSPLVQAGVLSGVLLLLRFNFEILLLSGKARDEIKRMRIVADAEYFGPSGGDALWGYHLATAPAALGQVLSHRLKALEQNWDESNDDC